MMRKRPAVNDIIDLTRSISTELSKSSIDSLKIQNLLRGQSIDGIMNIFFALPSQLGQKYMETIVQIPSISVQFFSFVQDMPQFEAILNQKNAEAYRKAVEQDPSFADNTNDPLFQERVRRTYAGQVFEQAGMNPHRMFTQKYTGNIESMRAFSLEVPISEALEMENFVKENETRYQNEQAQKAHSLGR